MADIPQSLRSWSATAASNSPNDNTTIGSGLDDNLRSVQATVRQFLAHKGTAVATAATMDLSTMDGSYASVTGNTTVTGLGTEPAGISYWLRFASTPQFTHSASLVLSGGASRTMVAGDVMQVRSEGSGVWVETSYLPATFTGTGVFVKQTSPTLTTPVINTMAATGGSLTTVTANTQPVDDNSSMVANTSWVLGQAAGQTVTAAASSALRFLTAGNALHHPGVSKSVGNCIVAGGINVDLRYPAAGITVTGGGLNPGIFTVTHGVTMATSSYHVGISPQHATTADFTHSIVSRTTTKFVVRFYQAGATDALADPESFSWDIKGPLA